MPELTPGERITLLTALQLVPAYSRIKLLRGDAESLEELAVSLATAIDAKTDLLHELQAVIDDAVILLRTGRLRAARCVLEAAHLAWFGRPKPPERALSSAPDGV